MHAYLERDDLVFRRASERSRTRSKTELDCLRSLLLGSEVVEELFARWKKREVWWEWWKVEKLDGDQGGREEVNGQNQ